MECSELKQRLLSLEAITGEMRDHFDRCENCRRFAAEAEAIRRFCQCEREAAISMPPLVRYRTLYRSRDALADAVADRRLSRRQRWGRRLSSAPVVATVVVILGMILLTVTTWQLAQSQDEALALPFKLTLTLIVAQNMIAALLTPAILIWRNRNTTGHRAVFAQGE